MSNKTIVYVPGTIYWAKIVGYEALHPNYDGDARQWAYELVPDDTDFLKEHRLLDRLKDKDDPKNPNKGEYLSLKKPEFTKDGEKNFPIKIEEPDGTPWDGRLLGNGTRVVAKLSIVDWGKGKKKSIYTQALRIDDLVEYEGGGGSFANYEGDSPKTEAKAPKAKPSSKGKATELDDLDDDVPF